MAGKVVVVNDDELQRLLLTTLLRKAGFDVCSFDGAERALAAMEAGGCPCLVITDVSMPEIDGWRFCRLLRSTDYPNLNLVPILVVSAIFAGDEPRQIAADLGAEAFLPCPIDGDEFLATVRALLEGQGAAHKVRALVVEDDVHLARVIADAFVTGGYLVNLAESVSEARALFQESYYDVAVIDEGLPDGSGSELLSGGKPTHPGCAFIMMSGSASPGMHLLWMKAGASVCITKPFDIAYLLACCERARRERALVRSEEMLAIRTQQLVRRETEYRSLVAGIPDAVMRFDREGRCLFASDNTQALLGVAQANGRLISVMDVPASVAAAWQRALDTVFASAQPHEIEFSLAHTELGNRTFSWRLLPELAARTSAATTDAGTDTSPVRSVITFAQDVTARKAAEAAHAQLQQHFLQAQKMQTVGRLAGGVAHNFNNMLSIILGNIEMAMDILPGDSEVRDFLRDAYHAGQRSASTTRQLLAFTRQQTIVPVVLDLNACVEQTLQMLHRLIDDTIELVWLPDASLWRLRMDPAQINQVLVNLCVNARDAISPHAGQIEIRTANCEIDESFSASHIGCAPGSYVCLRVRDSGCGMHPDVQQRAFEPFFTTKDFCKGTGLGLSTVYGIVKQNNGYVAIDSKVGQGTVVTVYLPRLVL